jgi:hypothetical protein
MRSDVERVIADLQKAKKLGQPRSRGRRNIMFDCPFHSPGKRQSTPSFGIEVNTGEWNCYNPGCGRKGPRIQILLSVLTGVPEEEANVLVPPTLGATKELRRRLGKDRDPLEGPPRLLAPWPKMKLIYDDADAKAYMAHRRIPPWVWDRLRLQYAHEPRIQSGFKKGPTIGGRRIVFPMVMGSTGIGFMARSIARDPLEKWRPISSTEEMFYDPLGFVAGGDTWPLVFLVEGEFSLAACVREGLPVICTLGSTVSAWKAAQLQRFDRIVPLFDADAAGRKGRDNLWHHHGAALKGRLVNVPDFPEGHDPASVPPGFGPGLLHYVGKVHKFSDRLKRALHV